MTNYCWRARWAYADSSGDQLNGYAEQCGDFVAGIMPGGGVDTVSLIAAISANFVVPAGASITLLGVSSSQTSIIYS